MTPSTGEAVFSGSFYEIMRRLEARTRRPYEQGASIERLRQCVSRWCSRLWGDVYVRLSRTGGVRRYWVRILTSRTISDVNVRLRAVAGYRLAEQTMGMQA